MFEDELPESDSSDEDFVPTGAGGSDVSEEDSDNAVDEEQNDDATVSTKRKRASKTKSTKGKRKKKMTSDDEPPDEAEIEKKKPEESAEEKKKHADALWADFMKDCGPTVKKQPEQTRASNSSTIKTQTIKTQINDDSSQESKSHSVEDRLKSDLSNGTKRDTSTLATSKESGSCDKVVEVYEFAGEKVVVEKKVDPNKKISRGGSSGGVAAILSQLNKKGKLSTLEKSKLDWEGFKDKEGINEEISAHNKGKNGYLEKQDFLERADLRQFELEKEMRAHNRSKRL